MRCGVPTTALFVAGTALLEKSTNASSREDRKITAIDDQSSRSDTEGDHLLRFSLTQSVVEQPQQCQTSRACLTACHDGRGSATKILLHDYLCVTAYVLSTIIINTRVVVTTISVIVIEQQIHRSTGRHNNRNTELVGRRYPLSVRCEISRCNSNLSSSDRMAVVVSQKMVRRLIAGERIKLMK